MGIDQTQIQIQLRTKSQIKIDLRLVLASHTVHCRQGLRARPGPGSVSACCQSTWAKRRVIAVRGYGTAPVCPRQLRSPAVSASSRIRRQDDDLICDSSQVIGCRDNAARKIALGLCWWVENRQYKKERVGLGRVSLFALARYRAVYVLKVRGPSFCGQAITAPGFRQRDVLSCHHEFHCQDPDFAIGIFGSWRVRVLDQISFSFSPLPGGGGLQQGGKPPREEGKVIEVDKKDVATRKISD